MSHRRSYATSLLASIAAVLAVAVLLAGESRAAAMSPSDVPRVLLLHPSDIMLPGAALQDQITRDAIRHALDTSADFYSESFDSYRLPGANNERAFVDFLIEKYAARPPHLVVTHGPMHALMSRHTERLWPEAPRMFVDVAAHRIAEGAIPAGVPYTSSQMDAVGTVELAMQLHPQAKRIVIVVGDAAYDRDALARVARELAVFRQRLSIEILAGRPAPELIARLAALETDSVVLHLTVHTDAAGQAYVTRDLVETLSSASAAPLYSYYDTFMGHGIVGGNLMNRHGQRAAIGDIARRLLSGERAAAVQSPPPARALCTLDWRQVKRWNIDSKRIPPRCEVLHRPQSVWERHKGLVTLMLLAALAQLAWIPALHRQRKQRRNAEVAASRLTSELTHAARLSAVGGLVASITHELTQPLTSILTNAAAGERLIASGRADLKELRSILVDIRSDDARARTLITHLRAFLKKREVSLQPVRINELVMAVLKIIEPAAREQQVKIVTDFDERLDIVAADPVHLQQVMLNIVANGIEAIKMRDAGSGQLTVRTRLVSDATVEVAVSDTGCGIPPERMSRLFEPFFSTKRDGMGIGLSIAQTIIAAHGGRIWAESDAVGTTFRFAIPLEGSGGGRVVPTHERISATS